MAIDVRKEAFQLQPSPGNRRCSCGCDAQLTRGMMIYARPSQGRSGGITRIVDLEEHYQRWVEDVAHQAAAARAATDPAFRNYLRQR